MALHASDRVVRGASTERGVSPRARLRKSRSMIPIELIVLYGFAACIYAIACEIDSRSMRRFREEQTREQREKFAAYIRSL